MIEEVELELPEGPARGCGVRSIGCRAILRSAPYAVACEPTAPTEHKTLDEKVIVRETGRVLGPSSSKYAAAWLRVPA